MDVTPLVREGAQIIQGYADGGFRISGQVYGGAVLVFSDRTIEWALQSAVSDDIKLLDEVDFVPIIEVAGEVDVVLLGTGKSLVFPDPALKRALKERGLNIEAMDSGAACRTYNVLMAEGRRVVAAILPA